jgi:hypothetical protein
MLDYKFTILIFFISQVFGMNYRFLSELLFQIGTFLRE